MEHSGLGRHLGDRGNRTLKWAFIEAAHGAVRSGGRWRAMFDRLTDGGTRDRNRGYIKVARELVWMGFSPPIPKGILRIRSLHAYTHLLIYTSTDPLLLGPGTI